MAMLAPPGGYASGPSTTVNTMTDPLAQYAARKRGTTMLTRIVATLVLLGSLAVPFVVSSGLDVVLVALDECLTATRDAACLTGSPTAPVWQPLILAAVAFSATTGAFVDAARRPLSGLLLAIAGTTALAAAWGVMA